MSWPLFEYFMCFWGDFFLKTILSDRSYYVHYFTNELVCNSSLTHFALNISIEVTTLSDPQAKERSIYCPIRTVFKCWSLNYTLREICQLGV